MRSLASVDDDAIRHDHGGGSKPDLGHFLGHGPSIAEVHMG